jgi:hypothetical protein
MRVEPPVLQQRQQTELEASPGQPKPQPMTKALLVLFLIGVCLRGYEYYGQQWRAGPSLWMAVVRGTADAPDQYRVGVVFAAFWMSQHLHLSMIRAFAVMDLGGSVLAALLLYRLLERTETFGRASLPMRWFGSASFLALTIYYIDWTNWYLKVSTLPSAGLVAAMLWLWTPRQGLQASSKTQASIAAGFLTLTVVEGFIRADLALAICLGIFVVSLAGIGGRLALPRLPAIAASLTSAVAVAAIQLYLMKIRYPHATYAGVPVFMLKHDYFRLTRWTSCLVFLAPFLWTVGYSVRERFAIRGAGAAFLLASTGYLGLWLALGRLDEVRIFIPMALVNLPFTVELVMRKVQPASTSAR